MAVLSKAVKLSVLAAAVYAAPRKQKKGSKLRNLMFLAPAAVSAMTDEAQYQHDIMVKHAKNQDELSRLLQDKDDMLNGFNAFMTRRYGQVCNDGAECADYQLAASANAVKDMAKFHNFQENVMKAYQRNEKSNEVVHGITSVMDLSADEFNRLLGYKIPAENKSMLEKTREAKEILGEEAFNEELAVEDENSKKDWRDENAITPVKDQATCGSCWAFSTVESIESAAIISGKSDPSDPFIGAPAQLVDCDKMDDGCSGGLPSNAFKYLKHHALDKEDDYPYQPEDEKCTAKKHKGYFEVTKATQLSHEGIGEKHMKNYLMTTGPISIGVAANRDWQTYQGGLMDKDVCPDVQPNHAVQAVAVNTEAGKPYWTVRNSWAEGWGEDGFIRLTYGKNTCNIAFMGFGVQVKKIGDDTMVV